MEHRKNLSPTKTYVPSSWLIVLTALVCLGGAGWLGWLLVDDASDPEPTAAPSTTSSPKASPATSTPTPRPSATRTTPEATPKPSPSATTPKTPEVARDVAVSVLNNTGVTGAAQAFSGRVGQAGWPLGGIGNWTGAIPSTTVYYPAAYEAQARLLARDLGIGRVLPAVSPMRTDRLTIILSGPQS